MATKLIHGCSYSNLWVNPSNWESIRSQKALKKTWYIQCKFFDPEYAHKYPNGFPYRKKVNRFKTLEERKDAIRLLLEEIPKLFENKHYNPISKKFMKPIFSSISEELAESWFVDTLYNSYVNLKVADRTRQDIKSTINSVHKVAKYMYPDLKMKELHSGHVRDILDHMDISNYRFNKHLAHLSIVISELVEKRVVVHNCIRDIRKRKQVKKVRETLTIDQLNIIFERLKDDNYNFYRFSKIFFYSGARISELMRVQDKDVDLMNREYKVTILKGGQFIETVKPILPGSWKLWNDIISEVKRNDQYIFSAGLVPGYDKISERQITRRWKRYVKDGYGYNADFYAMKHLFLDIVDSKVGVDEENLSSKLASHTSSKITDSVYLVNKEKRYLETLKNLKISI